MKLTLTLLGLPAAMVLPLAPCAADPVSAPRPFSVQVTGDVAAVSAGDLRYPAGAAVRDIEGACTVRLAVTEAGTARDIEVVACSSDLFRREAAQVVRALRFDSPADSAVLQVRWSLDDPRATPAQLASR